MTKKATFGAGCFWGVEAAFRELEGVIDTAVGFMGGSMENPSYKDVCRKDTGHAEVCQVEFDPRQVSYEKLLEVFWKIHDPTQLNRQGPDVGDQYRSVVFYHDEKQKDAALKMKARLQKSDKYKGKKIVTGIEKSGEFYRAEEYHQKYLEKKGVKSCHI